MDTSRRGAATIAASRALYDGESLSQRDPAATGSQLNFWI